MNEEYRKYIIDKLFVDNFFEQNPDGEYELEETDPGGETCLHFKVSGKKSMAIKNLDKKNTGFLFLRDEKSLSLKKRADHMIFEQIGDNQWLVHLIEMKSSISSQEKWLEIKGKFRASYLFVLAAAAILHMDISEIRMYTTYEKVSLDVLPENPVFRRMRTGSVPAIPQKEWNGESFGLRFGDACRLNFRHIPIRAERNEKKYLEAWYACNP